ncbi:o-spanin [Salmonella phage SP6]|uniref:O-spanin n=1 Tax=Enterobacteria phage SP6 TaxID=2907955 RepID=Q7Y5M2_BPSP6
MAGLLGLLLAYKKKQDQKEAQHEADLASDDPADWFADHFRVRDGVTRNSEGSSNQTDSDGSLRER